MVAFLCSVNTLRVDTVIVLLVVTNITSRRERKLDGLKSESKGFFLLGAANDWVLLHGKMLSCFNFIFLVFNPHC